VVEWPFVQLDVARALQRSRAVIKKNAVGEPSWDVIPSLAHETASTSGLHASKRVGSSVSAGTDAGIRSEPTRWCSPQPPTPVGSG